MFVSVAESKLISGGYYDMGWWSDLISYPFLDI